MFHPFSTRFYQSEYRLRQDQVNKERIENKETKGIISSREERRNNGCDRTSRDRDSNRDRSPSRRKTSVETDSRSSRSGSSSRYGSEYSRKSSYDRGHDRYRDKNRRWALSHIFCYYMHVAISHNFSRSLCSQVPRLHTLPKFTISSMVNSFLF